MASKFATPNIHIFNAKLDSLRRNLPEQPSEAWLEKLAHVENNGIHMRLRTILAPCALWTLIATFAPFSASTAEPQQRKNTEDVFLFGGTGNDLLQRCSHPEIRAGDVVPAAELVKNARDNGMCVGYIAGVSDQALNLLYIANTKRNYCLQSGVTSTQLVMVVKKYLEDNPSQLHLPAGPLTLHALTEAFPCR